jgi:threonyl-tRNA synthetase
MVMVHGDDKGLVLPPKVASVQVIVIPVPYKDADTTAIKAACELTVKELKAAGVRADLDTRENYSPGWKYSHWEMKGIPLRIEIGPRDLEKSQVFPCSYLFIFFLQKKSNVLEKQNENLAYFESIWMDFCWNPFLTLLSTLPFYYKTCWEEV